MRRSCSSRSTISSWTSSVCRMTRLRFVSKGATDPGPPTSSQVSGWIVAVINWIRLSKSAIVPPPAPPGPKPIGIVVGLAPVAGVLPVIWARMLSLILPLPPEPLRLATTAIGEAIGPPYPLPPKLTRERPSFKAPASPIPVLGMKLGIGTTRSATL